MSRLKIISIGVDTGSYGFFVRRIADLARQRASAYVCVANVHMVVEAHSHADFAAAVNSADLVTPDGMPLSRAMKLLYGVRQERVAGMDLLPDLLDAADRGGIPVFLYGSTCEVLSAMKGRIAREHPRLHLCGTHSPPFRPLTDDEDAAEVALINGCGAAMVLVALGCPRQERWMAAKKGRINAVMVGVGGAFPVYAGLQGRAPWLMQRLCLEWLYRLCQEPRRLFGRYLVTNSVFMALLVREILGKWNKSEGGGPTTTRG